MNKTVPLADKALKVYVRKGAKDDERLLSFRLPSNIPQQFILTAGMALDGNAVLTSVGFDPASEAYRHPPMAIVGEPTEHQRDLAEILRIEVIRVDASEGDASNGKEEWTAGCTRYGHSSIADALNCVESLLAIWLYEFGYSPEFA